MSGPISTATAPAPARSQAPQRTQPTPPARPAERPHRAEQGRSPRDPHRADRAQISAEARAGSAPATNGAHLASLKQTLQVGANTNTNASVQVGPDGSQANASASATARAEVSGSANLGPVKLKGDAQLRQGASASGQVQGEVGPDGIKGAAQGQLEAGTFGEAHGSLEAGPVKAEGDLTLRSGVQASGSGHLNVGPDGVDAGSEAHIRAGNWLEGKGKLKIGETFQADGTFRAGQGARLDTQSQVKVTRDEINIQTKNDAFVGTEGEAMAQSRVNLPGGAAMTNKLEFRAAEGLGGFADGQLISNQDRLAVGERVGMRGPVGIVATSGLESGNGSKLEDTTILSMTGGVEGTTGFDRDNKLGTTSLGAQLALPIPGTPLTVGVGKKLTVADSDVRAVGNALAFPGAGDLAVMGLNQVPKMANTAWRNFVDYVTQ